MAEKVKYQSMAELARELKITRQTLYNRVADHNIDYSDLTFTAEEIELLATRPNSYNQKTPRQKQREKLSDVKQSYETMITKLKSQHNEKLRKESELYQESLAKQQTIIDKNQELLKEQNKQLKQLQTKIFNLQTKYIKEKENQEEKLINLYQDIKEESSKKEELFRLTQVQMEKVIKDQEELIDQLKKENEQLMNRVPNIKRRRLYTSGR